jgi:hypothetical protein
MYRRALLGVGALALATSAGIGVGSGVAMAGTPTVTFSGPVTCGASGLVSFSKPLKNGGKTPTNANVSLKLSDCSTASQSGVTLESGSLSATTTAKVANDCGDVLVNGEGLPAMKGKVAWKASGGHATDSVISVTSDSFFYDRSGNKVDAFGKVGVSRGSFKSESGPFTDLTSKDPGSTLDAMCFSGLKSFVVGKSGNKVTGSITIQAAGA